MTVSSPPRPSELVEGSIDLASPPLVYERLMEVINHPRGGAADVAYVIREDTALTARLLKVVNSAFFSFPRRIDTVSQAVTVVGTTQVRDLALATSVVTLFKDIPGDLLDMDGFWRHSLACGVAARVLAGLRREGNVERYFVSGILHDVGKLVMCLRAPGPLRQIMEEAREGEALLQEIEGRVLGFDHAQVGEALLDLWNMPANLRETVRFHHSPHRAERFPLEAAAIHVADVMANALGLGNAGQRLVPPLSTRAWDAVGVDPGLTSTALGELERQYEAAVHLVGLEVGP